MWKNGGELSRVNFCLAVFQCRIGGYVRHSVSSFGLWSWVLSVYLFVCLSLSLLIMAQMLAKMDVCMGGRVAEEMVFGHDNVTSGATSDFQQVSCVRQWYPLIIVEWRMTQNHFSHRYWILLLRIIFLFFILSPDYDLPQIESTSRDPIYVQRNAVNSSHKGGVEACVRWLQVVNQVL